tara:strand:+ start:290 stop:493 length:204 start_codon:yes stop_codon:yes gene_type:complete
MAKTKNKNSKIKIDLEEFVDLVQEYLQQDDFIETQIEFDGMKCLVPEALISYVIEQTGEFPRHMGIS